ncbi:MAG: hypothetical protein RBS39_08700 [Phycisphaerales bacterium]|jgi:hypothetical protein|nr:hypothetical protein [Phycisphaerales bacterium]
MRTLKHAHIMILSVLCIAIARDSAHAQQMPSAGFYERAAARAESIFGKDDNGWAAFEAAIVDYAEYQERIDEPTRENEDFEQWLSIQLDALRFGEYPRPGLERAEAFLRSDETTLHLKQIDEALRSPTVFRPWDASVTVYDSWSNASHALIGRSRQTVAASTAQIRLAAANKRSEEIPEHVRRCLLLARAMSSRGLMIDCLLVTSQEMRLNQELRTLVVEILLDEVTLRGVINAIDQTPPVIPFEMVLESERDFCMATFVEFAKENGWKARPKKEAKFIDEVFATSIELARNPRRGRAASESMMQFAMRGLAGTKNQRQARESLVGSVNQVLDMDRTIRFDRAATRAMLLIALHRAQTGEWPQTIEGLAIPEDPIANRPFVYRRTPDAEAPFILYSVGSDGIDNGGKEKRGDAWDMPTPDDEGFDFVVSKARLPYTPSDSLFPLKMPSGGDASEDDSGE